MTIKGAARQIDDPAARDFPPETLAAIHAAAMILPRPWSVAEFASLLSFPGTFATGAAQAFALGRVILDEAELLTLATHPDHRRQGLARAALSAFETEALDRGAATAFLEVAENNAPARALYCAAGYTVTGRRPGYYRTTGAAPVDALLMARLLSAE